jgi:hypothetical protein
MESEFSTLVQRLQVLQTDDAELYDSFWDAVCPSSNAGGDAARLEVGFGLSARHGALASRVKHEIHALRADGTDLATAVARFTARVTQYLSAIHPPAADAPPVLSPENMELFKTEWLAREIEAARLASGRNESELESTGAQLSDELSTLFLTTLLLHRKSLDVLSHGPGAIWNQLAAAPPPPTTTPSEPADRNAVSTLMEKEQTAPVAAPAAAASAAESVEPKPVVRFKTAEEEAADAAAAALAADDALGQELEQGAAAAALKVKFLSGAKVTVRVHASLKQSVLHAKVRERERERDPEKPTHSLAHSLARSPKPTTNCNSDLW